MSRRWIRNDAECRQAQDADAGFEVEVVSAADYDALADVCAAGAWRDLEQDVPREGLRVLVYDPAWVSPDDPKDTSRVRVAHYDGTTFVAVDDGGWDTLSHVTLWRPMPDGPKNRGAS